MLLCLDVGNSHIYAGVFDEDTILTRFRCASSLATSDEMGIFLKTVLRENECDPHHIQGISICSVVPQLDYSLRSACLKYFNIDPFILQTGVKTGLQIKYCHPQEVGADRIANAIAAVNLCPKKHLIVIDFGTATTFCAISKDKAYLGGAIMPGLRLQVESLAKNTAKLPSVDIVKPEAVLGRSTKESIQSGVFFGVVGATKEIVSQLKLACFSNEVVTVIATGGFASMFEGYGVYDEIFPDLVLKGIQIATKFNVIPKILGHARN
jgi:type III pantothenate kinase